MSGAIAAGGLGVEGECKVIPREGNYNELETLTMCGWVLVAIIQENDVHHGNSYWDSDKNTQITEYRPVHNTYFVLRRSAEETMAAMASAKEEAEQEASVARSAQQEAVKAMDEAETKVTELEEQVERQSRRAASAEERMNESDRKARKLELQMEKVTRAVGELNLKEILGEEE